MDKARIYFQTHRFRDSVAVALAVKGAKSQTVYLTARDARKLTRAINRVAKSCESEMFKDSRDLTAEFTLEGEA